MYEVADEIDQEKEALKEDLVTAEAKLASNLETHEEVSRVRHEEQLLLHQVADLNTWASHIEALQASRNLE
jgi:hypothetical protein